LVEAILKKIREDERVTSMEKKKQINYSSMGILEFVGILDDNSAIEMENAVIESRKIDFNDW